MDVRREGKKKKEKEGIKEARWNAIRNGRIKGLNVTRKYGWEKREHSKKEERNTREEVRK